VVTPRIGVLALQGDFREHIAAVRQCDADAVAVRTAEDLDRAHALIIPGGESTTIGMLIGRNDLTTPLEDRLADGMPIFGTCAGMILLAADVLDGRPDQYHLGAIDMTVRRNAFGRQVDSFEASVEVPDLPGPAVPAVFIRAPWVERVGPQVEVLARVGVEDGTDRIVAVRQGRALATSFHPEVTDDRRFHRLLVDIVQEET
jgi:5'-phosphate synthase pdxT subunit